MKKNNFVAHRKCTTRLLPVTITTRDITVQSVDDVASKLQSHAKVSFQYQSGRPLSVSFHAPTLRPSPPRRRRTMPFLLPNSSNAGGAGCPAAARATWPPALPRWPRPRPPATAKLTSSQPWVWVWLIRRGCCRSALHQASYMLTS